MRASRKRRVAIGLGAVMALAIAGPPGAHAGPPAPRELRVVGGEEAWRASNVFHVKWRNPRPGAEGKSPLRAVHYLVRDPSGAVIGETVRLDWVIDEVYPRVPDTAGAYTTEVWLEDEDGKVGPRASATLRYDDARPGHVAPRSPGGWVGRTAFPYAVHLDRPAGEPPASGIRGYAVAVDETPNGSPCARQDRCADDEIDLRGGDGDDAFSIEALLEGTSYVHVVAVSGSGMRSATPGSARLRVDLTDPVTALVGAPNGWTRGPVALTAAATDAGSGMEGEGPFTAIRVDGGTPRVEAGASSRATVVAEGVHSVAYYARDAAGNVNDGGTSNGWENRPPSRTAVRIDRGAPEVSFASWLDPRDPELIRVRVRDRLSGPDRDRGWVGVRRVGSDDRFRALPVSPDPAGFSARWDSESYPPGEYEFLATGYDAAGNAASAVRRGNGTPMVVSNPLKAPTALRAGFGGRVLVWHRCRRRGSSRHCRRETVRSFAARPARRLVPFGRGVVFSGRLSTAIGVPLAGKPVRVVERFDPGSSPVERVSTVRTTGDGRFAVRLSPGPSREVFASFAGTRTLGRTAAAAVRLGVRGGVRLRVSAAAAKIGGRPLVFRGRVLDVRGGAAAPGERAVQLQFRVPGQRWSEFRTLRADRRGRFRYAYRFSDDDSRGVRFQFRAVAPTQGGWPFEPGSSRSIAVRGR